MYKEPDFLLSVRLMTYNHGAFIIEAMESIDAQQTNFDFEVVVGDDFSTDDNLQKINSFVSKNPRAHWKILRRTKGDSYHEARLKNGRAQNFYDILKNCSGKYVALIDGDDYWIDFLKLQKQVNFMEGHPDFALCYHPVDILLQENNTIKEDYITRDVPSITTIKELADGNFIHTPSVMLRNDFQIPEWFSKSPIGDWTLYMLVIKDKKIKKISSCMAIYRVHYTSIWSNKSRLHRVFVTLESYQFVLDNISLSEEVKNILRSKILGFKSELNVNKKKRLLFKKGIRRFLKYLKK